MICIFTCIKLTWSNLLWSLVRFFFHGVTRSLRCPETLEDLKNNIEAEIARIPVDLLVRVHENSTLYFPHKLKIHNLVKRCYRGIWLILFFYFAAIHPSRVRNTLQKILSFLLVYRILNNQHIVLFILEKQPYYKILLDQQISRASPISDMGKIIRFQGRLVSTASSPYLIHFRDLGSEEYTISIISHMSSLRFLWS